MRSSGTDVERGADVEPVERVFGAMNMLGENVK